jgi:antirestriction protein ArdC
MLKTYHVFNVEQIEGLPETPHPTSTIAPIEAAERFIAATKADIRFGGSKACYVPSHDFVAMPPKEAFTEASSFYATNLHDHKDTLLRFEADAATHEGLRIWTTDHLPFA